MHPTRSLARIRERAATWWKGPAKAYAVIYDTQGGEVKITGGPFGFWQMATWRAPPGSPIGSAPGKRSKFDFPPGKPVWFLDYSQQVWNKGVVVSFDESFVYVVYGGKVRYKWITSDEIWPRDEDQLSGEHPRATRCGEGGS